eukprot:s581_g14.t1
MGKKNSAEPGKGDNEVEQSNAPQGEKPETLFARMRPRRPWPATTHQTIKLLNLCFKPLSHLCQEWLHSTEIQ